MAKYTKKIDIDKSLTDLYTNLILEKKHDLANALEFIILNPSLSDFKKKIKEYEPQELIETREDIKTFRDINPYNIVSEYLEENGIDFLNNEFLIKKGIAFEFLNLATIITDSLLENKSNPTTAYHKNSFTISKSFFDSAILQALHDSTCSCLDNDTEIQKKRRKSDKLYIIALDKNSTQEDVKKILDDWDKIIPNLSENNSRNTSNTRLLSDIKIHNKHIELVESGDKWPKSNVASWAEKNKLPGIKSFDSYSLQRMQSKLHANLKRMDNTHSNKEK